MDGELINYRGYTIEIDKGLDGWAYAVAFGMSSLGRYWAPNYGEAVDQGKKLVDDSIMRHGAPENIDILLARLENIERRLRRLEQPHTMTGSTAKDDPRIFLKREGFAWFYRLSPYKEWIGPFDSEAEATAAMHLTSNRAVMTGSIEGLDGPIVVTFPEGWFSA